MGGSGRTVIITGGGQGIGRATALRLRDRGWRVVIAERDREAGEELAAEEGICFLPCDVSREEEVRAMVREAAAGAGLHALVNNAAISRRKPLAELSLAEWQAVLDTNLTGPMLCAKHAAPHLAAKGGAIVNIASTRALMSEANTEAYSASKGGLVALTHALAVSLGPAVRVNCISPGWIETGDWKKRSERRIPAHSPEDRAQHPVGRVGRPSDIAALIEFLISDEAGFITGAHYVVDGGMTRKMIYVP
ncbi:MAG TPA: SDR family oxidoreductase [Gammaproteobacteria bacterium]|nr:SDR family oxidoreductase [Gammaproteobacteria bacterium]